MSATVKVRMINPRGNPVRGGAMLARGAAVEVPKVWADRFIADGDAEPIEPRTEPKHSPPKGKGKK